MCEAQLSVRSAAAVLPRAGRLGLVLQREVSRLLGPLWMVLATGLLCFGRGYRIERVADTRRQYRQIRRGHAAPLLICANHLTLIDSALIASALGSPWWYLLRFSAMPWNMPERTNFAFWWPAQVLAYVMKCLPITRGGPREEVAATLQRFVAVLANGDAGLVFPEGGRSRSGRIDKGAVTYGIGRIVRALPGCRVLCVYLRGAQQTNFSDLPARGDRFHVELKLIEPRAAANGLRADRDIARQIVAHLAEMEQRYFNGRQ